MKSHAIATALFRSKWKSFATCVIPPWIDGMAEEERQIKDLFSQAKEVIRQRNALTALKPEKKEQYRGECEDVICELAVRIHELSRP